MINGAGFLTPIQTGGMSETRSDLEPLKSRQMSSLRTLPAKQYRSQYQNRRVTLEPQDFDGRERGERPRK
jgi:hypothetical protein